MGVLNNYSLARFTLLKMNPREFTHTHIHTHTHTHTHTLSTYMHVHKQIHTYTTQAK